MAKYRVEGTTLPNFLKELRSRSHLNCDQVAKQLNMVASSYNGYETAKTKNIPLDFLEEIIEVFYQKHLSIENLAALQLNNQQSSKSGNTRNSKQKNRYINAQDFTCIQLRELIIKKYSSDVLKNELWAHALYLDNMFISISKDTKSGRFINKTLEDLYGTNDWRYLFQTLNQNTWLPKPKQCTEENKIFIFPLSEKEKKAGYLPIFRIKYNLYGDELEKYIKLSELEHAINITDLFMLIFNAKMDNYKRQNEILDEQAAFKSTCTFFHDADIPIIYNEIGMFDYPKQSPIDITSQEFNKNILTLLADTDTTSKSIEMFKRNYMKNSLLFMDVIAVDFSFIRDLSGAIYERLKSDINELTKTYKQKYIYDNNK